MLLYKKNNKGIVSLIIYLHSNFIEDILKYESNQDQSASLRS